MLCGGPGEVWLRECVYEWYTWFRVFCLVTGDVLEMSVVRGVGGVCDMCMCLARDGVAGERESDEKIGFWL